MRSSFLLILALLAAMSGCKKDEDNTPQGPSGPVDTWVRVLEVDSSYDFVSDIAETTDGGFVLAGNFNSAAGGGNYAWKVNSVGDTLWTRHYLVGGGFDAFEGALALADGGMLAVGYADDEALLVRTNESGGMVWQRETNFDAGIAWNVVQSSDGNFIVAANGGLFKINSNGDTVWTKTYDNREFFGVIALDDGGALASGNRHYDTENNPAVVIRITAAGDTVWTRELPLPGMRMYPWEIVRTGDGEYVTAGQYQDFPSGDLEGGWVAKFSESGQVRWSNTYATNGYFYDLAVGPDGLPVVVGGIEVLPNIRDILLMKLDNSGNDVWTRTYLSGLDEAGYAICATSDGGFVVAGTAGGVLYPDIILIKVDEDGEI